MDLDERHEPEMWVCPSCGEVQDGEDEGVLMNLGGVGWEEQPTWCQGCAGEVHYLTEGFGVV
jgi:hypothetical protein